MRFGNTPSVLIRPVLTLAALGILAATFSLFMMRFVEHKSWAESLRALWIAPIAPAVFLLGVVPTVLFSIHLHKGYIEHRLMDRWVLSRAPVADYKAMKTPGRICAAVLEFKNCQKMHFFGAQRRIIEDMRNQLAKAALQTQPNHDMIV